MKLEITPLNRGEHVFYIKDSKVFTGSVIDEHYSLSGTNTILKYIKIEGFNTEKGDSGSPIINSTGEVVGIVSAISDNNGKILTYATPINDAYKIIEYLLKDQIYPHKLLGIKIEELPNYHKQYPGLKISEVLKGSLAYQKLQIGDVIKKYNDIPIITYQDLGYALFDDNNASNSTLLVQRDGNLISIEILMNE